MYNGLIQKDTDALKREKSSSINKYNISKIFDNMNAIFTGAYFLRKDVPKKTIVERTIAKRVKLWKEKIAEIKKEKKHKQ